MSSSRSLALVPVYTSLGQPIKPWNSPQRMLNYYLMGKYLYWTNRLYHLSAKRYLRYIISNLVQVIHLYDTFHYEVDVIKAVRAEAELLDHELIVSGMTMKAALAQKRARNELVECISGSQFQAGQDLLVNVAKAKAIVDDLQQLCNTALDTEQYVDLDAYVIDNSGNGSDIKGQIRIASHEFPEETNKFPEAIKFTSWM